MALRPVMNQEQFSAFWTQLKAPLKAKWEKITDADLLEIAGNLTTFTAVLAKRYGSTQNAEVNAWATDAFPLGRKLYECLRRSRKGCLTNCAGSRASNGAMV